MRKIDILKNLKVFGEGISLKSGPETRDSGTRDPGHEIRDPRPWDPRTGLGLGTCDPGTWDPDTRDLENGTLGPWD